MRSVLVLLGLMAFTGFGEAAEVAAAFWTGYNAGAGGGFTLTFSRIAEGFPFQTRLGLFYATRDPGVPDSARRIFINDNHNGVPTEFGSLWEFDLDLMWTIGNWSFYLGPRFARFVASFRFVGGNEDFSVVSKQWGVEGGVAYRFPVNARLALIFSGGAARFFDAPLYGHDTSYSPNGEAVNPRKEYTYRDADRYIDQPKREFRGMVGLNWVLR